METLTLRYSVAVALALLGHIRVAGQTDDPEKVAVTYFNEIRSTTAGWKDLWNYDLYAPILLVQPHSRMVYANISDSADLLKKSNEIFVGTLPANVNIANTSMSWNGTDWAMVMLPLPANKQDRLNLLAHELFHRAQPRLGFSLPNVETDHLDKKDGRIYLRLELEALHDAINASSQDELRDHIANALVFRSYRHSLFPGADSTENHLELNEGLAEYTGMMMSGRTEDEQRLHLTRQLQEFLANPTFVRSFAYQTIPMYGYLLHFTNNRWNQQVTASTNLSDLLAHGFRLQLPDDLKSRIATIIDRYGGKVIIAAENQRQAAMNKLLAEYWRKFVEQSHLDIPLRRMNISFDPRNLTPLENKGVVYPNLRITDDWGILTVAGGALRSPNWDKVTVTAPILLEEGNVSGDGWTLELNAGFTVEKDSVTGNYVVHKK